MVPDNPGMAFGQGGEDGQKGNTGRDPGDGAYLMLRARELRERARIVAQGQEEQCSLTLAMLGQLLELQQRALIEREGIVRRMLEAGARRMEAHLFDYYQTILELTPNLQYGRPVSLTHPDGAASPQPQPPTPPVPYAGYLQQWDGGRGQGGRRAEGGWEGAG